MRFDLTTYKSNKEAAMRNRGGFVLVSVMSALAFLTLAGASILTRGLWQSSTSQRLHDRASTLYLAEAAADQAMLNISVNNLANILPTSLASGTYSAENVPLGDDRYAVMAHGVGEGGQRDIEVIVKLMLPPPFDYAVFAAGNIQLNSNAVIDSFDSAIGSYGGDNINNNGDAGTNGTGAGTITLDSNAKIKGDATIGVGGITGTDIVTLSEAEITGTQASLVTARELPSLSFPSGSAIENLVVDGGDTVTISAGVHRYGNVLLNSNASVLIAGTVILYVENDFVLDSNANFTTTCGDCTVSIFIEGTFSDPAFDLRSNNTVSAGGDPSKLTVYITGDGSTAGRMKMDSNTELYGAVYAPLSMLEMDSNSQLFGATITKTIDLNSDAQVHYDEQLNGTTGTGGGTVSQLSWREI